MSRLSRFDSAVTTYEDAAHVQRVAVNALSNVLFPAGSDSPQNFKSIFEFGCGTGLLTREILRHVQPQTLWLNDASDAMLDHCCHRFKNQVTVKKLPGNAEVLAWPTQMDLIASSSTVQWFEKPLDVAKKAATSLKNGGVFALTGFLPGTLEEVSSLTGVGLTYPKTDD